MRRTALCSFCVVFICLVLSIISFSQTKNKTPTIDTRTCSDCFSGRAITLAKPKYPARARRARLTGRVAVVVTINARGIVVKAKAGSGDRVFWPNAERAALRSKFHPAQLSGKPVAMVTVIVYNFALDSPTTVAIRSNVETDESLRKLPIVNGKAVSLPKPEYPESAKSACSSGFVDVVVNIDEAGDVKNATVMRGDELLWKAAENAARKARFTNHGHAPRAKWSGRIRYNFPVPTGCPVK